MLKIKEVKYDSYCANLGCETCDYGSNYIDNFEIIFDDDTKMAVHIDTMYNNIGISESDLIKLCINAQSKNELKSLIIKTVQYYAKKEYNDVSLKINDEWILTENGTQDYL